MTPRSVITVSGIRKTYGRTVAVDDVSFDVEAGEIFGLIGPNGAGKTTTLECVEGLRRPDRGTISVLGLDPFRQARQLQDRIGVQLQAAQLQKRIKVWEAVDLWASLYTRRLNGTELLEQLGLTEKRNAWFMTLSGGQKQRLFIALALINDPEVVFLDELTTGLDPQARRAIWDLVRGIQDRGKTVFLTTHLMEEAERLCDRVAILEHGRIADIDTPAGLVRRHCPERTIVVATDDPSAEEYFRRIPGVRDIGREDSRLRISGQGEDLVTAVIQCLSAWDRRLGLSHDEPEPRGRVSEADGPLDSRLTPRMDGRTRGHGHHGQSSHGQHG
jgi:ABC-2 type transport system ATP-binding protein